MVGVIGQSLLIGSGCALVGLGLMKVGVYVLSIYTAARMGKDDGMGRAQRQAEELD